MKMTALRPKVGYVLVWAKATTDAPAHIQRAKWDLASCYLAINDNIIRRNRCRLIWRHKQRCISRPMVEGRTRATTSPARMQWRARGAPSTPPSACGKALRVVQQRVETLK